MKLYIRTFGDFDIIKDGQSMISGASRQYRLFRLFQYFVTYRNKRLLPETILDNLLQDTESDDPRNVLRTQIYRLRQFLKTYIPSDEDESDYFEICFTNGYYYMEIGERVVLDVDLFESLISEAGSYYAIDINKSIELYRRALELYKGYFFAENAHEIWLIPTRNYYNRLYLKVLFKFIDILKEEEKYEDIIEICEKALILEPYEESVHAALIDAMLKLGHINNAISHYDYIALALERDVGIKPSPVLKNVYGRIQNHFAEKVDLNITNIDKKLDGDSKKGAIQCDFEYFKFLYNVQKRRIDRSNENNYLCIITFKEGDLPVGKELSKWRKNVEEIIRINLRQGDIFTFWNDLQIILMTHDVKDDGKAIIENRIKKSLNNLKPCEMEFVFQPLSTSKAIF